MMKRFIVALAVLAGLSTVTLAQQAYPNRLIKIIHGFPPGGNVDIIARVIGNEMEKSLGQSIVIEAKPGLAGALAAEAVARSEPDGYTLLVLPSAHPAYGALAKNVKFKVVDDFTWISVASFYPFMICVKADSRFKTLKQLIDEARAKPGELKYGSAGVGTILHTTVELMANQTRTKFLHVPYRGEAPVLNQIPFGPNDWDADLVAAHVERGVVVEGYSGFKRTDLRAPALVAAAQAHGVTVPQVVVRWHVQHDVVVIPKSKTPDRIAANIDVDGFALSADEMAAIDALGS